MGKLIDVDTAIRAAVEYIEDWNRAPSMYHRRKLTEKFMALKPVDAVPVRCKDCRYNSNPPECGNAACVLFYGMTDQMGFCHHGERREQDETD